MDGCADASGRPLRVSRRALLAGAGSLAAWAWLSQYSPAGASTGPGRPLFLVHGFGDRRTIWYRSDNAVVARLSEADYHLDNLQLLPFTYPPFPNVPESEDSQGDIVAAGLLLAHAVRLAAAASQAGQVDIIGFSMGGLVTRVALDILRVAEPAGQPLVNTVVLVATPNAGADILAWANGLSDQAQLLVRELALEVGGLDLTSVAARQMLPASEFLQRLNELDRADDRVRYVLVAGDVRVQLRAGSLERAVELGDGFVSTYSATMLPGQEARVYLLPDSVGASDEPPLIAVRRSNAFHGRLLFNDDVALTVAAEVAPWHRAARDGLSQRLESGAVVEGRQD